MPVAVDFFQTSSYRGGTSPGEVRIRKDVDMSIRGHDVLLVEDIVDTGYTLRTILDLLRFRGARSVKLCALLDKAATREGRGADRLQGLRDRRTSSSSATASTTKSATATSPTSGCWTGGAADPAHGEERA